MAHITTYINLVEQAVCNGLLEARVFALVETEFHERDDGYWERIYVVAWENAHEFGTHRVCIDSEGKAMCVWGHYCSTQKEAMDDFSRRLYLATNPLADKLRKEQT